MNYEEDYTEKVTSGQEKDLKTFLMIKSVYSFFGYKGFIDMTMTLFNAYAIDNFFEKGNYETVTPFIILYVIAAIIMGFFQFGDLFIKPVRLK